jgi:hypothetical protein
MDATLQVIGSFAAAAIAWVALEFAGRPLRKFFDLRYEVIRRMAEVDNVRARWREIPNDSGASSGKVESIDLPETELSRLHEAQATLRDLASQLRAFAGNEGFARSIAWVLQYDPLKASEGLFGLSKSYDTYGKDRAFYRKIIYDALRIRKEF